MIHKRARPPLNDLEGWKRYRQELELDRPGYALAFYLAEAELHIGELEDKLAQERPAKPR